MAQQVRYRTFEMRAAQDAPEGTVEGYITVFGTEYPIGWGLRERIEPGAFDASLAARGGVIPIYYQHDHRSGGTPIGVGEVTRDDKGYWVRAELFIDDDPKARTVWRTMAKGALREWSVGFTTAEEGDVRVERDVEIIQRGDLMEASVVLRGANPDTETLAVRSEDGAGSAPEEQTASQTPAESTRSVPDEWLDRLCEPHIRELVREVALSRNEVREILAADLRARYESGDATVWIVDMTDSDVTFEVAGAGSKDGCYRSRYTRSEAGVELDETRVPVMRKRGR